MARAKRIPLAGVVSLGCSKNLVDTEYLVGGLGAGGWGLVPERYIYGKAFLCIWPPREAGVVD